VRLYIDPEIVSHPSTMACCTGFWHFQINYFTDQGPGGDNSAMNGIQFTCSTSKSPIKFEGSHFTYQISLLFLAEGLFTQNINFVSYYMNFENLKLCYLCRTTKNHVLC
jgi:hypothetical protein